ncbi:MAG: gluconolactonase [Deltaproteobacteria bacterium HGW-Deltaproteobacteria-12]|jgi:sugar lactone lactonase YvrE|nr:MAG: gluconolactonase [Deltaproteobacteria bacterium HGW-Deltaproteobacteria-12]
MNTKNPLSGFQVDRADIHYIGHDLQRPECILAEPDGTLWSADARGGVVKISPDGSQEIIAQSYKTAFESASTDAGRFTEGTLPNGLAFAENGDILISNFGTDSLEVMTRSGQTRVLYDRIDGEPIGKVNFVLRDRQNRIWLTISTRIKNWMKAVSPAIADGYIALVDEKGLRIVADGFRFTNEIRLDAREEYLYIVETCGQCITRMHVGKDGSLTNREIYGPTKLGRFGFPDGIAFDSFGNLWGTLVMVDQVFAITPDGDFHIVLDDTNETPALALEQSFAEDSVTPDLMLAAGGTIAPWFASVTFGGPDLKTVYVGSLRGTRIPYFRSPVAGLPMVHWK